MSVAVEVAVAVGWRERAACRGRPVGLWYAEVGSFEERVALAVCRRCPVRRVCLDEAVAEETGDAHGVRGGMTAAERSRLVRASRRSP